MAEIIDALDNNFQGYENVLSSLSKVPKFGNDITYVDSIVNDTLAMSSAIATRKKGFAGATSAVAAAAITANIGLGFQVGALPDGRMAGEPLSEGGLSPNREGILEAKDLPNESVQGLTFKFYKWLGAEYAL